MALPKSGIRISRRTVYQPAGEAGLWEKMSPMYPKATASPGTPEKVTLPVNLLGPFPRANPVPAVMAAAGYQKFPSPVHVQKRDLMHGMTITAWNGKRLIFFVFRDGDNFVAKSGNYPAAMCRVPRGALFHCTTQGHGPPPHTIHWHGIEPTPINDGVGHCSMEIGNYLYQWQPNFIGTYFYHCHRNTVQHFEFGLFGLMPFSPPDSYYASIASVDGAGKVTLNSIPIGAGRDGLFRTAANLVTDLEDFTTTFPGFIGGDPVNGVYVPDPWTGDPALKFPTDPHAFTVPFDVEAIWVLDDRDSVWSDFAPSAFAFFPKSGNTPGSDDRFARGFFNDYRADYWFVTGVPVVPDDGKKGLGKIGTIYPELPPPIGGSGGVSLVPFGGKIPPHLNGGITGGQIKIDAKVNQTIFIRCLDAAYNSARITFPFDVVIIEFDGRALGVPPFGLYNHAFRLPANTPILICTARRFGALARFDAPFTGNVIVEFLDSQGATISGVAPDLPVPLGPVLQTVKIPVTITA